MEMTKNIGDNVFGEDGDVGGDDVIKSGDGDDTNVGDNGYVFGEGDSDGGDDVIKSGDGDDTNYGDNYGWNRHWWK